MHLDNLSCTNRHTILQPHHHAINYAIDIIVNRTPCVRWRRGLQTHGR